MAHFYDADGKLHTHVPYADPSKGNRDATLADARKQGWGPSVTGVLGALDKPQLTDWRVAEGIKAALKYGTEWENFGETEKLIAAARKDSEQYRDWSAEFGTQVHRAVSQGLLSRGFLRDITMLGVQDVADAFLDWIGPNGVQVTESEVSFYSSLGYGGTIDLLGTYYGEPFIGDLKTQDWGAPGDKNKRANWYDPEWPLQLAGYELGWRDGHWRETPEGLRSKWGQGIGADQWNPMARLSFVLSRTRPGLIEVKQWPDPDRYDAAWLSLWDHWQAVHKWGKWAKGADLTLLQGGLLDV